MSNTITAYFKGRVGVAESVYQYDHGLVMVFDSIYLPAHFDCYFSAPGSEESIPAIGADNRVVIPDAVLNLSGAMSVHIPIHTGENDSEVEYIAYFRVVRRARPVDDGTPAQMTAIEQAIALLQNPTDNIEQIVSEALAFTGETFEEMQEELDTWKGGVDSDIDSLEAQFQTAISAVTTDTEVTNIRVGADGVTYTTAGEAVRGQFTDLKSDLIGTRVISSYVQGARNGVGNIVANNARVTVASMANLAVGDVIEITGLASGQKFVLASTAGLDSGWKTADYKYIVTTSAKYFINVAWSDGTTAIAPSDVSTEMKLTTVLSIKTNKERIDSINSGHLNTKNLVGMKTGVLYPVNIPAKTPFTMSTSDGSAIQMSHGTQSLKLNIYDENGSAVDYFSFTDGLSERTVSSNWNARYMTWTYAYPIPLQVELGVKTSYVPYVPVIKSLDNTPKEHEEDRTAQIARKGYFEINSADQMAIGTHDTTEGYYTGIANRVHSADICIPACKGDHVIASSDTHDIVVAVTSDPFGNTGYFSTGWKRSIDFVNEYDGYYIFVAKATLGTFDASFKVVPAPFVDIGTDIADYYEAEMSDTIAKVREANDEPSLVFPLVTDIHRYTASVQSFAKMIENLTYLNDRVKCDFLVNLGDTIEGDQVQATSLDYAHSAITDFRNIGLPFFITEGNHDNNPYKTGEPAFDIKQCFSAWYSSTKDVTFNTAENGTDYFIDFHNLNVRLVCINSCNVNVHNRYAYGTTTANWLIGSALNTNYSVILIEHLSSIPTQVWSNNAPTNYSAVTNAIKDFVDGGGQLIQFSGHSHVDLAFVDPWLSIMQVCQKFEQAIISTEEYQAISGYIDVMGNPARTANTATEDAWSVCVYKPYSNILHMIRFGAGIDRIFHATPIAPTTVTTQLDGEVTWSSSDTSVATVSSGVITGVASGKCAILAKDADGNYECWIVRVI